jgi:surface antigen
MLAPGGAGAAAPGNTPSTGGNVVSGRLCSGYDGCDAAGMPSHDYSSGYYTSWWDMDPGDECTNYVAYVESTVYGVPTPDYELGNAADWPAAAAANGVVVNSTPTVGSVAVWNPYSPGIGPLGHVAVVEEVGPRNSWIVISQQHLLADADGYEWTRLNPNEPGAEWEAWPNYFIHFRGDLPFEASLDAFAVSVRGPSLASVAPLVRGLAAQAPEIGPEMKSPTVTTVEGMIADDQQQVTAATNTAESVLAAPALAYQLTWPTALWSLALDAEQALTFAAPDHPAPQILAAHDPLGAQ